MNRGQMGFVALIFSIGLAGLALALLGYMGSTLTPVLDGNKTYVVTAELLAADVVNNTSNLTANRNLINGTVSLYNITTGSVLPVTNYSIDLGQGNVTFTNVNTVHTLPWSSSVYINYSYTARDGSYTPTQSVLTTYGSTLITLGGFLVIVALLGLLELFFGIFGVMRNVRSPNMGGSARSNVPGVGGMGSNGGQSRGPEGKRA